MNCPHCQKPLPASFVDTRATGSKGGKVKSPLKARSSEQARAAVMARWAKARSSELARKAGQARAKKAGQRLRS